MSVIEPYLKHKVIQLEKEVSIPSVLVFCFLPMFPLSNETLKFVFTSVFQYMLLNALKPPVPRTVYDTVIRSSELNLLLQTLTDRRNSRKGQVTHVSLPSALPASPQQNSTLRNVSWIFLF